jgi:hypothetical protein
MTVPTDWFSTPLSLTACYHSHLPFAKPFLLQELPGNHRSQSTACPFNTYPATQVTQTYDQRSEMTPVCYTISGVRSLRTVTECLPGAPPNTPLRGPRGGSWAQGSLSISTVRLRGKLICAGLSYVRDGDYSPRQHEGTDCVLRAASALPPNN